MKAKYGGSFSPSSLDCDCLSRAGTVWREAILPTQTRRTGGCDEEPRVHGVHGFHWLTGSQFGQRPKGLMKPGRASYVVLAAVSAGADGVEARVR